LTIREIRLRCVIDNKTIHNIQFDFHHKLIQIGKMLTTKNVSQCNIINILSRLDEFIDFNLGLGSLFFTQEFDTFSVNLRCSSLRRNTMKVAPT
jgi:hypothetical protein